MNNPHLPTQYTTPSGPAIVNTAGGANVHVNVNSSTPATAPAPASTASRWAQNVKEVSKSILAVTIPVLAGLGIWEYNEKGPSSVIGQAIKPDTTVTNVHVTNRNIMPKTEPGITRGEWKDIVERFNQMDSTNNEKNVKQDTLSKPQKLQL